MKKTSVFAGCALAAALVLGAASTALAAPSDFETEDVSGGVKITKYVGAEGDDVTVVIPDTINGKKVVQIGKKAFFFSGAGSVVIPNTVTSIGELAFWYASTAKITFEDGSELKSIGKEAFGNTEFLETIKLPSSLKKIKDGAFMYSGIKSITIPAKVKTISEGAFTSCDKLKTLKLKSGLTTIEEDAFSHCKKLKKVSLPKTATKVHYSAFASSGVKTFKVNKKNKKYAGKDNILYNKKMTKIYIWGNGKGKVSYTVPKKVTSIGTGAFYNSDIKKVKIKKNVKTIGKSAFSACAFLKSATLTGKVKTIKDSAFDGCGQLSKVTFGKKVKTIGKNAFYDCENLETVTVPKNVTKIGKFAFGYHGEEGMDPEEGTTSGEWLDVLNSNFTMKGKKSSAAYKYVKANKITFKKA